MKRKTLTLTICFLALVSIVSIGFASWVISRPVESSVQAGSISAEAVDIDELNISLAWNGTNNIHYGKPNPAATYSHDWLSNDSESFESLTVTLDITLEGNLDKIEGLNLKLFIPKVVDDEEQEIVLTDQSHAFGAALYSNYIALPTVKIGTGAAVEYDVANGISIPESAFTQVDDKYTVSVTLYFGWGTAVGSVNPLEHFNSMEYSDVNATAAETALEAIYALHDLSYKVKVSPVLPSQE